LSTARTSASTPVQKIAFLCGCAEPGRDGVGDYTARLAAECARRGLGVLRIALNDRYVSAPLEAEGLLRLPAGVTWGAAVEATERFAPDAVSMQWVPYSFHPRGLPWGIERPLRQIIGRRTGHLMCHETWIGTNCGADIWSRYIGANQRVVLRRMMRGLRPACVHTSNASYAGLLAGAGISAGVLPLFGAIPITGVREEREAETLRFGMFGEVHTVWPPEPLLTRLLELGRPIQIEHIGRIGRGEGVWDAMTRCPGITFKRHGEQPVERISQFLMDMDFGIATTPLALIGKSGTAAAMLEHGLPVIVNRDDVRYRGIEAGPAPEGVIAMDGRFLDALRGAERRPPQSRLAAVADQFLASLGGGAA
jgi:hypothetical protein